MEYLHAALLLHHLGKPVTEEGLRKVIEAGGSNPDELRVKALVAALKEVNIEEALKSAALAPTVATAAPAATPAPAPGEAPKEEKKEEAREEALEGLAALFG